MTFSLTGSTRPQSLPIPLRMNPTQQFLLTNFKLETFHCSCGVIAARMIKDKDAQTLAKQDLVDEIELAVHTLWYIKQTIPKDILDADSIELISHFEGLVNKLCGETANLLAWKYDAGTTSA